MLSNVKSRMHILANSWSGNKKLRIEYRGEYAIFFEWEGHLTDGNIGLVLKKRSPPSGWASLLYYFENQASLKHKSEELVVLLAIISLKFHSVENPVQERVYFTCNT